jgi:predicted nucleic acid-binding protein
MRNRIGNRTSGREDIRERAGELACYDLSEMWRVYLETSVVSYLTARPSQHLITAAHQLVTARWWETRRSELEIWTSELVLEEASRGDREAAAQRLALLEGLPLLQITPEASRLASAIVRAHLLPDSAFADALHIAIASTSPTRNCCLTSPVW